MLNLLMSQLMAILKQNGFDGEAVQRQIGEAIADLKAMKESQDRCEAMLEYLALREGYDSYVASGEEARYKQQRLMLAHSKGDGHA